MFDESTEYNVTQRINKRLLRIKRLLVHLIFTVVLALGLTYLIETRGAPRNLEAVIIAGVLVFLVHALWVSYSETRHFIIQQEVNRADDALVEKPKRDSVLTVGDDGELVPLYEDETPEKMKRRE